MHEEFALLGPLHGAADESQWVAVDGGRGPDLDDSATLGGHDEQLFVGLARAQRRQREARGGPAHGQLDQQWEHAAAREVAHLDAAGGGLADGDPGRVDVGADLDLGVPDGQRHAGQEEDEAGDGDHREVGPLVAAREEPRDQAEGEDGPPQR